GIGTENGLQASAFGKSSFWESSRIYRPGGVPDQFSVQSGAIGRYRFRARDLFRSTADLRFGLSARSLQDADGDDRLPLLRGAGDDLCVEGRKSGEYGGEEMPLQCPHGEYRPSPDTKRQVC